MRRSSPRTALVALALLVPLSAQAADPGPPAAVAAPRADDLVRRRDGAEFRGRIAARVPNSHVDVVTLTGQAYRIPWGDVTYAGPVDQAPVPVPAASLPGAAQAPLPSAAQAPLPGAAQAPLPGAAQAPLPGAAHAPALSAAPARPVGSASAQAARGDALLLTANRDGLTWLTRTPDGTARTVCTAPCETPLPQGPHHYGMVVPGREAVWDPHELTLTGSQELHATYYSRRPHRVGGAILAVSSLLTTAWLMTTVIGFSKAFCSDDCDQGSPDHAGPALGIAAVGVAAIAAGIALMARQDEVVVEPRSRRVGGAELPTEGHAADEPPAPVAERPRYTSLQPALWACLPDAEPREVTLVIEFDAAHTVQHVAAPEGTPQEVEGCMQRALTGTRVDHAPAGPRTLRFKRPAAPGP